MNDSATVLLPGTRGCPAGVANSIGLCYIYRSAAWRGRCWGTKPLLRTLRRSKMSWKQRGGSYSERYCVTHFWGHVPKRQTPWGHLTLVKYGGARFNSSTQDAQEPACLCQLEGSHGCIVRSLSQVTKSKQTWQTHRGATRPLCRPQTCTVAATD